MAQLSFSNEINNDLYNKINSDYENGKYTSAIKDAILFLTESIRERTDLDLDGDQLVTKVFSEKDPYIKINNLKTKSEKNEQIGFMQILQGFYKGIRNPRNHNLITDDKYTCDCIIIFVNYLIQIIQKSKPKFDFNEFYEIINDPYFNKTENYTDELIKLFPNIKLLDITFKLINSINDSNYDNISFIILSIKKRYSVEDKKIFIETCNNNLLKTKNFNIIKTTIKFLRNDWKLLNNASQLRIENILCNALKNMQIEYNHITNKFNNYENVPCINEDGEMAIYIKYLPDKFTNVLTFQKIKPIIEEKLLSGDDYIDYIFGNFYFYIFDKDNNLYPAFENIILNLLNKKNDKIFNILTSGNDEPFYGYSNTIKEALNLFQQNNT